MEQPLRAVGERNRRILDACGYLASDDEIAFEITGRGMGTAYPGNAGAAGTGGISHAQNAHTAIHRLAADASRSVRQLHARRTWRREGEPLHPMSCSGPTGDANPSERNSEHAETIVMGCRPNRSGEE
jgi:hypothetical protein